MRNEDDFTRRQWLGTCASAAGIAVLAGCSDGGSSGWSRGAPDIAPEGWPMHGGGPMNTRHRPEATGPADSAETVWEFHADQYRIRAEPAVVDGTAYISGSDKVRALDAGELLWETSIDNRMWGMSTPLVVDDTVYVGGSKLVALDRSDGTVQWTEQIYMGDEPRISYYDGAIYCPIKPDRQEWSDVLKFDPDAREGERLADFETGTITRTPAIANDTLYLTSTTGVHAIDVESASHEWHFEGADVSVTRIPPAVADGTVYAIAVPDEDGQNSQNSCLLAIDATSGEERWRFSNDDISKVQSSTFEFTQRNLAVADGTVYLPTDTIQAIDAETGERRWEAPSGGIGSPAVADGVVYGSSRHFVVAMDPADGSLLWESEELPSNGGTVRLTGNGTVPSGGYVYQPGEDWDFYALG